MRYYHRTSIDPDRVIDEAVKFIGDRMATAEETPRRRTFAGALGHLTVTAQPEGGHYTRIEVATDQVGESELDKLAKRFLATVHTLAHSAHDVRGAY